MSNEKIINMINKAGSDGKFFTVVFRKKNGTMRTMNCRLGVKKHLAKGVRRYPQGAIGVYDVKNEGYRCFYPNTVISINHNNISSEAE